MPEGDTIHRTARTLSKAIGDRAVVAFESPLPKFRDTDLVGRTVRRVFARGKNLLIEFDDDRTLYSHMKMDGSWHVYRPGERWRARRSDLVARIETAKWEAVCFSAPVVELLTPFQRRGHPALKDLGPDLIADELDDHVVLERFRKRDHEAIGVALMNQGVVAGIGNVYKSELLFIHRVDPFQTVQDTTDATILALVGTGAELLKKNLKGSRRRTRFALDDHYLWVYDRSGRPCLVCSHDVRMKRQGATLRSTYFCPTCQGALDPKESGG